MSAGCAASSEAGAVIGTSDGTATEKQEHTQEALKMKPTGGAAGEAEAEGELMCAMLTGLLLAPAVAVASPPRTRHARADNVHVSKGPAVSNKQLKAGKRAPLSTGAVAVEDAECCVCMEAAKSHSFIPCGHRCVCETCADNIMTTTKECPVCRGISMLACKIYG